MVETEKIVEKDNSEQLVEEILGNEEDGNLEIEENVVNEREFKEVDGGLYNDDGFYITPNGSFWDPDGIYFNREGFDKHEGYYDDEYTYHPGRGWMPHLLCYEDELHNKDKGEEHDDINEGLGEHQYDYDNVDDLHEEVDYGNLADNIDKSQCLIKKNVLVFTGDKKPKINQEEEIIEKIKVETKVDLEEIFK